uniref:SPRY-associated domain-containing protein n=1 Tax=Astyanax mexicanus TaxID=7994 RepID=A0A3B1JEN1_ASTMX
MPITNKVEISACLLFQYKETPAILFPIHSNILLWVYCEIICLFLFFRLASCNLGVKTCENLESVLNLENSSLKELDLSNNDLQDSGVELLSAGLKSSQCKLQILRLSGCMITDKGCCSLASALISNPSHLKELDLTYNHPGESGMKLLSARLEDQHCKLEKLGDAPTPGG